MGTDENPERGIGGNDRKSVKKANERADEFSKRENKNLKPLVSEPSDSEPEQES